MHQPISINHVLPPDLFTQVFDFLSEAEQLDSKPFGIRTEEQLATRLKQQPLLQAMLVCRAWYSLIRTTPKYWTSVAIGVGGVVGWGSSLPEELGKESLAEMLEQVVKRSGHLPIDASVVPDRIPDFGIVTNAIRKHASRLGSLSLIPHFGSKKQVTERISAERVKDILGNTFPALEQFVIGPLSLAAQPPRFSTSYAFNLDAPQLRRMACERHFIIPHSASRLTYLSLYKVRSTNLDPPLSSISVELPQLLELHLSSCEPGEILPTLFTPSLQTLIAYNNWRGVQLRTKPPQYTNLRELQWSDVGSEACFQEILELSPNLTRYSNYVLGKEEELDVWAIDEPATILDIVSNDLEKKNVCSMLREVFLDVARGQDMDRLITAVPSIQRLRILRDPESGDDDEEGTGANMLAELRKKVDWEVGRGPWRGTEGVAVNMS